MNFANSRAAKIAALAASGLFAAVAVAVAATQYTSPLPGMPPVENPADIYAADHAGNLSPAVRGYPALVYVPNSKSDTVDVIDQKTYKIVGHFSSGGREPQHVVPQYDMKRLWVINDLGDSATDIDPATGKRGRTIPVEDPYNMYYTPDGKYAIVVAERKQKLNFLDPQSMKLVESLPVNCPGIDHMDFTADGRFLIASCEFSSQVLKVDVAARKVVGTLAVNKGGMPQDVKTSPDG
ncbi:MAG TPA: YncE family protein, partial [Bryobacteraceae bacterium]|nr:YncE family protein [Bryobacteraceae bacterium]